MILHSIFFQKKNSRTKVTLYFAYSNHLSWIPLLGFNQQSPSSRRSRRKKSQKKAGAFCESDPEKWKGERHEERRCPKRNAHRFIVIVTLSSCSLPLSMIDRLERQGSLWALLSNITAKHEVTAFLNSHRFYSRPGGVENKWKCADEPVGNRI